MTAVAVYLRVSTEQQDLDRQERTVPALAERSYPHARQIVVRDDGKSAFRTSIFEREGGRELVRLIEAGEVQAIFADAQDRLCRGDLLEWAQFRAFCKLHDVTIYAPEPIANDLGGELMGAMRALLANEESQNRSHRSRSGKLTLASKGLWPHGGPVPIGYRLDPKNRTLEKTEDAPAILEAFRRFADNEPATPIRAALGEVLGRPVDLDYLRVILRNPVYLGLVKCGDQLFEGQHSAIVSQALFDRVQRRLDKRAKEHYRPARMQPFAGAVRCGVCRNGMRFRLIAPRGKPYTYFECYECSESRFVASSFEANFVLHLNGLALELQALLAENPTYAVPHGTGLTLSEAQEALSEAQAQLERLGSLIADGALAQDDPRYANAKAQRETAALTVERLSNAAKSYREELSDLVRLIEVTWHLVPPAEAIAAYETGDPLVSSLLSWTYASFEQKRDLIERTVESIYVYEDRAEVTFKAGLPQALNFPFYFPTRKNRKGGRKDQTLPRLEAAGFGLFSGNPVGPT